MAEDSKKEKAVEYQMLVSQIEQVQQSVVNLENHLIELKSLELSLKEMKGVEEGKEILIPMGSGIFMQGSLGSSKKIIMNVGSGVCVEKNLDDSISVVGDQIKEVENAAVQMIAGLEEMSEKRESLRKELV